MSLDEKSTKHSNLEVKYHFKSILFISLVVVLITTLLIDSLLSDISSIINEYPQEHDRSVLFSINIIISMSSGLYLTFYIAHKILNEISSNTTVLFLSKVIPIIQLLIGIILVTIMVQINLNASYWIYLLSAGLVISWTTGVILMGILSFKFIKWYLGKKSIIILLFMISSVLFCTTIGSTIIPQTIITIESSPDLVESNEFEVKPFQANLVNLDSLYQIISVANWLVIPLSLIIWVATAVTLKPFSNKIGIKKFWVMIITPLVSFIIGVSFLLIFLPTISSIFDSHVIPYTMAAFGGILAEGFLLGLAFLIISKNTNISIENKINDYLKISGIGIIILFLSFFANPSSGSYLPYGIIAASFFPLGCYLFFVGIYSSVISISSDIALRKKIRTSLIDQTKLLDNIAISDLNRELENQVDNIIEHHKIKLSTHLETREPFSEEEIKNYVLETLKDFKHDPGKV